MHGNDTRVRSYNSFEQIVGKGNLIVAYEVH